MSVRDNSYGIADLQDQMLDILKYFDDLCIKNKLTYWAGDGTCLGAVRHKGFIPWDDDVDVCMPRHDYEKLWASWDEISDNPKYKLCRTGREKNYRHRVMQIADTSTTFINRRCVDDDIEHGVYIDIIPADAAAPGGLARFGQILSTIIYSVYNIQTEPEFHGTILTKIGTRILLKLIQNPERRFRVWSKAEREMTKYDIRTASRYAELISGSFGMIFKLMPSCWFRPKRAVFEDTVINIPEGYDKYLTVLYGDYMSLPPEDQRKIQHNTVMIDLTRPYTDYRGVYYCREERENDTV